MRHLAIALLCAGTLSFTASASIISFSSTMLGANETPPTPSPGTGSATVVLNTDLNTLTVSVLWSGLTAPANAAHIHCCQPPGVADIVAVPFTGFPAAASGVYSNVFDLTLSTTYNAAFITAHGGTAASAEAALISGMDAGLTYTNIHDANFLAGEIRGQLAGTVPEPGTLCFAAAGLLALALRRRKPRQN